MNICKSVAALPREEFEKTLELLSNTRSTLYLVGGRFTDAVATDACMHLRMLRPQVHHVGGTPLSCSEYILDMDSRSVVIAFDVRRYEEDIIRFANEAAERGARVVLVTDHWLSPIESHAEHVLASRIEVPSNRGLGRRDHHPDGGVDRRTEQPQLVESQGPDRRARGNAREVRVRAPGPTHGTRDSWTPIEEVRCA